MALCPSRLMERLPQFISIKEFCLAEIAHGRAKNGCRAQPPGSKGPKHSAHGPDDVYTIGTLRHQAIGHSRAEGKVTTTADHPRGAIFAARLRQDDRQRSRRGLYACSAKPDSPMTYMVKGKQYIVVAVSGGGTLFRRIHRFYASVTGNERVARAMRSSISEEEGDDHRND